MIAFICSSPVPISACSSIRFCWAVSTSAILSARSVSAPSGSSVVIWNGETIEGCARTYSIRSLCEWMSSFEKTFFR